MQAYETLTSAFSRHAKLNTAARKLGWDQRVMMPPGGADDRGEEMATLSAIAHETIASPAIADSLDALTGANLDEVQAANIREMWRMHQHAAAVPSDLISARETTTARCEFAWREARANGDYQSLLPLFEDVLTVVREIASAKSEALGVPPYDALMDPYDPGRGCLLYTSDAADE